MVVCPDNFDSATAKSTIDAMESEDGQPMSLADVCAFRDEHTDTSALHLMVGRGGATTGTDYSRRHNKCLPPPPTSKRKKHITSELITFPT